MAYAFLGLMVVLWIGIGILLAVSRKRRQAEEGFDPQTGRGVLVAKIAPLVILFYLESCVAAPGLYFILQVISEEGFSGLQAGLLIVFVLFCIALPLLLLLLKWRERTIVDKDGIQFPVFPFRLVRVSWNDITELEYLVHRARLRVRRQVFREVRIHTKDRVYKPTWDRATWARHWQGILSVIVERANLIEVEKGHWVRR